MKLISKQYLDLLADRDFFILMAIVFIGQLATSFLMLSLVVSAFLQTGSNFGVSGVILSFTLPGFLLMAIAGLAADLVDRKKIILVANIAITLFVLLILFSRQLIYASIPLSFLYFAGNSFFIPASSAASGQLVRKNYLLAANAVFIFTLSSGMIFGLFLAAVTHFFFGNMVTLVVCEALLLVAAVLSLALPKLPPRKTSDHLIIKAILDIWRAFIYIFNQKVIWFYFLIFAFMQGIIAFGVTLAPGFFSEIVNLSINTSPIFILPPVALGVLLGVVFVHSVRSPESNLVILGVGSLGVSSVILGMILRFNLLLGRLLLLPMALFLVIVGFGVIICVVASRTILQKKVSHNFQGTVFGANIILASLLAGVMAPAAAML